VLIDGRARLLAKAAAPTTGALRDDLAAVLAAVLASAPGLAPRVAGVMLGTTRMTQAVAGRHGLRRVAAIRIGSPLTEAIPPLATWPSGLRDVVSAGVVVVRGGAEYDGRSLASLDEEAIARFLEAVAGDADSVAITGVFSPIAPAEEMAVADLVRLRLGSGTPVFLSHEIGTIGLLERENATVLNAALCGASEGLATGLGEVLDAVGVDAEPFFARNDGTLMALEHALSFPVLMLGSGPASAMRGAAHLSGVRDGVVVDVGAGHTRVGPLVGGFPGEAPPPTETAGVRLNVRMPVIHRLPVGGDTELGAAVLHRALAKVVASVAVVSAPVLVAVGGGTALVPESLTGVSEVIRPEDGELAGAIGAATAPVSGYADLICANRPDQLRAAREEARAAAFAHAIHAGADPGGVQVVRIEEIPLTYLVDPAVRIRVTAAGPGG
jgi:N-methylhydantoinase A/oxoprolinase/acetone carboxylase beta subunit